MSKKYLPFLVLLIANAVLLLAFLSETVSASQNERLRFEEYVSDILHQTQEDRTFLVSITLKTPIMEDASPLYSFVLPQWRGADGDISKYVTEIGIDYVCIDTLRGAIRTNECIPFDNIAMIATLIH